MRERTITHLDWFWLLAVAALSFSYSGLPYFPFLNSDLAIHVYMCENLRFPQDLYFWGQDRLGSIVPMMGYLIRHLFFVPAIWAVSLAEYLLLAIGCLAWWRFIPLRWQRWAFAVLLFFPVYELNYVLLPSHPYGEQLAALGWSFVFIHRWLSGSSVLNFSLGLLMVLIAVWISDFSILLYALWLPFFAQPIWQRMSSLGSRDWSVVASSALLLFAGFLGLWRLKLSVPRDPSYIDAVFANSEQLSHSIDLLWSYTIKVITFQSITDWNSLMFFSTMVLIFFALYHTSRWSRWQAYFFVAFAMSSVFIISLRWLSINHVMLKYFIPAFYFLWLSLFLLEPARGRKIYAASIVLLVVGASRSLLAVYGNEDHRHSTYADLKYVPPGAYIGHYWSSYVLGISNPSEIITSPKEWVDVRNHEMKDQVMASDTIHVVLNDWLDAPPDTLIQYDHQLIRQSEVQMIGKFEVVSYLNKGRIRSD